MRHARRARPALRRLAAALLCAGAALGAGRGQAAATAPGSAAAAPVVADAGPDSPTLPGPGAWGDLTLAPIRWWGSVGLDVRHRDGAALAATDNATLSATGSFASFVWQPWFLRVQGSLGGILARDATAGTPGAATSAALVGDVELSLFPFSRFPTTFYAGVSDTRAGGALNDLDYRDHRLRLTQQYQHAERSERYTFSFEQSTLRSTQDYGGEALALDPGLPSTTSTDRLRVLRAGWARSWVGQTVEVEASAARNTSRQGRLQRETAFDFASLRHVYEPTPSLNVSTTASLTRNGNAFSESGSDASLRFGATFLQVASFASYRPLPGQWGHVEGHPLALTGTFRAFRLTQEAGGEADDAAYGASGSLGLTYDLRRDLQVYATVQALQASGGLRTHGISGSAGVNWVPEPVPLGDFRYGWSAGASLLAAATSDTLDPRFAGAQGNASHTLSRTWSVPGRGALTASLTQGVATRYDTREDAEQSLLHALSVFWADEGDGARQGYVGASVSDARRYGATQGSFQLANLQASIQHGLSRRAFLSGSVTVQATRSDEAPRVRDGAEPPAPDPNRGRWIVSAGGTLAYTHTAAFGVPRLQFQSILQADTFALRRRAFGDLDAPPEQVNWSFENRLDYAIGRLATSLVGRIAEIEGRGRQWQVLLRVQRAFGTP